jgi:hypothetical protein
MDFEKQVMTFLTESSKLEMNKHKKNIMKKWNFTKCFFKIVLINNKQTMKIKSSLNFTLNTHHSHYSSFSSLIILITFITFITLITLITFIIDLEY